VRTEDTDKEQSKYLALKTKAVQEVVMDIKIQKPKEGVTPNYCPWPSSGPTSLFGIFCSSVFVKFASVE
jgi:hypothetical protein